jgi:preprotein translocase subunit YajC
MDFFISNAYAADGAAGEMNSYFYIMLAVMGLFFYFMLIRPQQKRAKAHRDLMASISKGDEVLTNGGLIGRVSKVNENGYIVLELNDTTEVVIKRDFITSVLPKGTMKSL